MDNQQARWENELSLPTTRLDGCKGVRLIQLFRMVQPRPSRKSCEGDNNNNNNNNINNKKKPPQRYFS